MLGFSKKPKNLKPPRDFAGEFKTVYGFHPSLVNDERYQKEALVVLAAITKRIKPWAEELADVDDHDLDGVHLKLYKKSVQYYDYCLWLLNYFAPEFAKDIPHWSELDRYLKPFMSGKTVGEVLGKK